MPQRSFCILMVGCFSRSEVVVDAELSAVDVQRAEGKTRRELGEEGRAAKAAIEVFGLERPVRQEHPLHASADGPADLCLAVAQRLALSGQVEFIVGQS